ncbi:hypothetical protein MBLNU13_g10417t1 [Cladosporium sp. NU13]
MYQMIKKASLESKARRDPISGISSIAGEIFRRIRLRNPQSLAAALIARPSGAECERLTVAMHISHVAFPAKNCSDLSHVFEMYLIALVSKDSRTGTCYNTELKLCDRAEVSLEAPVATDPSATQVSAEPGHVSARPYTATDEHESICTAFDSKARARNLTYITLKEDKLLELHVQPNDIKPGASCKSELPSLLLVKQTGNLDTNLQSIRVTQVHRKQSSSGVIVASIINFPITHIAPTAPNAPTHNANTRADASASSNIPTRQGKSFQSAGTSFASATGSFIARGSAGREANPWGSPGTAGHGSRRYNETPTKSIQRPVTPSTPNAHTQHATNGSNVETTSELEEAGDAAELSAQVNALDLEEAEKETEDPLTQAEVDMMAELWDDRDLGLVGTK